MKPPVLVVCFRRPRNLDLILRECNDDLRDVFIFIDKSQASDELNAEVRRIANRHERFNRRIKVMISDTNLGVRFAVPMAIDWAMQECKSLIVLEDDCIPNEFALDFFESCIDEIRDDVVLVSGSTLPSFPKILKGYLYRSEFPLIWGWAVTKKSWELIRPDREISLRYVLKGLSKNPRNLIPILYFYAAVIRVQQGRLKAWDSPIALRMLIDKYHAIVPDCSVISNIGQDEVASHFEVNQLSNNVFVTTSGNRPPSLTQNLNHLKTKELNMQVRSQIYNMKTRHIFSPLKSLLNRGIQE